MAALRTVLTLSILLVTSSTLTCKTGYIMDDYCLTTLGYLLDKPWLNTLENPEEHSVHCLVDVGVCRNSGFWMLGPNDGDTPFKAEFQLDTSGNEQALTLARQEGLKTSGCYTCTNTGTLEKGFQATIAGTLEGNVLTTIAVRSSSTSCASLLASLAPESPPSPQLPPSSPPEPTPSSPPQLPPLPSPYPLAPPGLL